MPIIRITTNVANEARNRVATAITNDLKGLGMVESHIATLFQTATTDDLYEGSQTLTETAGAVGFALVQVGMTASRSDAERGTIATSITEAFDPDVESHRVSIDFIAREPFDVFVGPQAMGRRRSLIEAGAGLPARTYGPVDPVSEAQVREALFALDWKPEILSEPPDTVLETLRPLWMGTWDSLMAISTAEGLEGELGLAERTLERGQADFRTAFGATATVADLAAYVSRRAQDA